MIDTREPPLVSVIVIFFNSERFIGEAVDSVLCQAYEHWELLLVDDGSTDASTDIAKAYSAAHPDRIRYVEHPGHVNRGMSAARNLGIRNALGELIAFLDSDDVWLSDKLTQQVAIMIANPEAGMVCGAPKYWVSWGDHGAHPADQIFPTGGPQDQVSHPPSLLLRLYPLGSGVSPCPSDLMLRRDVLLQVRGFEEQFIGMYEDQAFLVKVYLAAPVYISSATWLLYRRHAGSCMASVHREGRYHAVRRYFLVWLDRYLKDQGVADREIRQALERARRPYRYPLRFWRGSRRAVAQGLKRLWAFSKPSRRVPRSQAVEQKLPRTEPNTARPALGGRTRRENPTAAISDE